MIRDPLQCELCIHREALDIGGWACAAFPEGIPEEIQLGRVDHRQPIDGDRGVQFELDPKIGADPRFVALAFKRFDT